MTNKKGKSNNSGFPSGMTDNGKGNTKAPAVAGAFALGLGWGYS